MFIHGHCIPGRSDTRLFADNLVRRAGFPVVCVLQVCKINSNPQKKKNAGWEKMAQWPMATFVLFFLGLGWPRVGGSFGFIIITSYYLVYIFQPEFGKPQTPYLLYGISL